MNDSALKRISYRAGVYRTHSIVYFHMRQIGEKYLSSVIYYAIIYTQYGRRTTISEEDVINAIEKTGYISLYPTTGSVKKCKISKHKKILSKIREYQQQYDCFTLAKAPIEALIKQETATYDTSWKKYRWSLDALRTLHFALEYMLYKLFFAANKIAIHSDRSTIQHKDISLAIELIEDNCQK